MSRRLHPRTIPVQMAHVDLDAYVMAWMEKHDLTIVEALDGLHRSAVMLTKFLLRIERHGDDSDKKADEE